VKSFKLRIKHSDWEKMASGSIEGIALMSGWDGKSDLILEIEQTTSRFRRANGGPEYIIVPEYTPWCILESVVRMTNLGVKITFESVPVEEMK